MIELPIPGKPLYIQSFKTDDHINNLYKVIDALRRNVESLSGRSIDGVNVIQQTITRREIVPGSDVTAFHTGGDSFGAAATLGTNDAYDLSILRGGSSLATFGSSVLAFTTNYRTYWGTSSSIFPGTQDYLAVLYTQNEALRCSLKNTSTGNTAHSTWSTMNDSGNDVAVGISNSGFVDTAGLLTAGDGFVGISNPLGSYSGAKNFHVYNRFPGSIKFITNNVLKATLLSSGTFLINTATASGSEVFRANGSIRIDGGSTSFIGSSITFNSTSGMNWDHSNNALLIGTVTPVATRSQFYVHAATETRLYARSTGLGAYCMLDRGSTSQDAVVFLTTAGDQNFEWSAGMRGSISTGSDYALHYLHVEMWKIGITGLVTNTTNTTSTTPMHTITQSGTGDAAFKAALGSTISYAFGIDNSVAGDPFVLSTAASASAVLGTGNLLTISSAGLVTVVQYMNIGTATDSAAQGDLTAGLTGAARMFYDQSVPTLTFYNSSGTVVNLISSVASTSTVWNEQGADIDFRIEGDTAANLFFLDASTDFIGINTSGPDRRLDILDTSGPQLRLTYTDGSVYADCQLDSGGTLTLTSTGGSFFFTGSAAVNYRVLATTHAYNFIDRGNAATRDALTIYCTNNSNIWATGMPGATVGSTSDFVLVDMVGGAERWRVSAAGLFTFQSSTSLGSELIILDQNDTDFPFIDFQGNTGANATASISTFTTGNTIQGFIQVEINSAKKWIAFYDDPTA